MSKAFNGFARMILDQLVNERYHESMSQVLASKITEQENPLAVERADEHSLRQDEAMFIDGGLQHALAEMFPSDLDVFQNWTHFRELSSRLVGYMNFVLDESIKLTEADLCHHLIQIPRRSLRIDSLEKKHA